MVLYLRGTKENPKNPGEVLLKQKKATTSMPLSNKNAGKPVSNRTKKS